MYSETPSLNWPLTLPHHHQTDEYNPVHRSLRHRNHKSDQMPKVEMRLDSRGNGNQISVLISSIKRTLRIWKKIEK